MDVNSPTKVRISSHQPPHEQLMMSLLPRSIRNSINAGLLGVLGMAGGSSSAGCNLKTITYQYHDLLSDDDPYKKEIYETLGNMSVSEIQGLMYDEFGVSTTVRRLECSLNILNRLPEISRIYP